MVKDKVPIEERKKRLKELITINGVWNLNKSQLGRDMGVSNVQIQKDIESIISNIPEEDVRVLAHEMKHYFKSAIKTAQHNLKSKDSGIQLKAVNALINAMNGFTEFLESWDMKSRSVEKIDVNNKISFEQLREFMRSDSPDIINSVNVDEKEGDAPSPPANNPLLFVDKPVVTVQANGTEETVKDEIIGVVVKKDVDVPPVCRFCKNRHWGNQICFAEIETFKGEGY